MGSHSKLIREARNLAAAKGHKIGEFRLSRIETGSPAIASRGCMSAICEYCGYNVAIDSDSPPGVSEIWGDALVWDCPGKVLADYQESHAVSEAKSIDDDLIASLQVKLDPRRFPNMSPEFAAVVGCLLKIHVTEPRLVAIYATSDGWLLGQNEGDIGYNEILGARDWLLENWNKLISLPELGLTEDECQAARELVAWLEKQD
jgi:hypothetical protein